MHVDNPPSLTQDRLRQYQTLLQVAESITAHRDLTSLLRDLTTRLQLVIKFDGVNVVLHDPKSNLMRIHLLESNTVRIDQVYTEIPVEEAPAGTVWQTQEPLLIGNLDDFESRYPKVIQGLRRFGVQTGYMVPLTSAGRRLGAIGFASVLANAWDESELELLRDVARLVAVAVENALNFATALETQTELTRHLKQLSSALEVSRSIGSRLSVREIFGLVARSLRETIRCDGVGMTLRDPETEELRVFALDGRFDGESIIEEGGVLPIEGAPGASVFSTKKTAIITLPMLLSSPAPVVKQLVERGIKSGCVAPLISEGKILGTLDVASFRENAFSSGDVDWITQLGGQIAIAVDNALNFERAVRAEREATLEKDRVALLLEINNAVVSHLDLGELVKSISSSLQKILPHDAAGIAIYDPDKNRLSEYANVSYRDVEAYTQGLEFEIEGTAAGAVFSSGEPMLLRKLDPERFPDDPAQKLAAEGPRSACLVPLRAHGRKFGVLGVGNRIEDKFTERDLELLNQVSDQIAIAVENSLNFERARRAEREVKNHFERLSLMLQVNNAVASQLDLRDLIRATSESMREVLQHDVAGISLFDPERNELRAYFYDFPNDRMLIEEGAPLPLEGSIGGKAFTSGQPVFLPRPNPDRITSDFNINLAKAGVRSGGCVPLIAHGKKLGVLGVASFRDDAFDLEQQELLVQIANQIAIAVENALAFREIEALKNKLASEKLYLEDEIRTQHNFEDLIGDSSVFRKILKQIETVAPTDSTVLICGETGTGKELIARAVHNLSSRRDRTLVKINCAAIPTGLLESELFGHERGAFTGAISQRIGRFELANRGTLFLDEVGDIPLELQPKLLRVLQEREFERLGSTRTQQVDVRIVAATNCNLEQLVEERRFRSDLFYRLNVFPILVPALRERPKDIPALARHFTKKYSKNLRKQIKSIPVEAMEALISYPWPGNVRELEHFIERAVILTRGPELEISRLDLKPASTTSAPSSISTRDQAEKEHIRKALDECNWVIGGPNGAAARLGMKRTTLQSRMIKLQISR